jgi:lipoprotein-anchoring transpeptidase ErfK/SrfK
MRRLAAAVALALFFTGCSAGTKEDPAKQAGPPAAAAPVGAQGAPAPAQAATTPTTAYPTFTAALAVVPEVEIFDEPGQATASKTLENPDSFYRHRRAFLVREMRDEWLKVLLPMRPNESSGWIRRSDVELVENIIYRLVVDVNARQLIVYRGSEVFLETPVAVGAPGTPTPGGFYYVTQELPVPPEQQDAYGPYALGLSAYSEVLFDFGGGDGQVGIHGTAATWSIGRNVSNGCIRLPNEAILKLVEIGPVGLPVEIRT